MLIRADMREAVGSRALLIRVSGWPHALKPAAFAPGSIPVVSPTFTSTAVTCGGQTIPTILYSCHIIVYVPV